MKTFYLLLLLFQKRIILTFSYACIFLLGNQPIAWAEEIYYLNPGDKLEIHVWEEEKLDQELTVSPDGTISFDLVGQVVAAGKTPKELANTLRERIVKYIPDAAVNVKVITPEGNMIYLTGEVVNPGAFVMTRPTNIMQALSMAGGLTEYAKENNILILRQGKDGKNVSIPFEYGDVKNGDNIKSNILLESGDTIVVP